MRAQSPVIGCHTKGCNQEAIVKCTKCNEGKMFCGAQCAMEHKDQCHGYIDLNIATIAHNLESQIGDLSHMAQEYKDEDPMFAKQCISNRQKAKAYLEHIEAANYVAQAVHPDVFEGVQEIDALFKKRADREEKKWVKKYNDASRYGSVDDLLDEADNLIKMIAKKSTAKGGNIFYRLKGRKGKYTGRLRALRSALNARYRGATDVAQKAINKKMKELNAAEKGRKVPKSDDDDFVATRKALSGGG